MANNVIITIARQHGSGGGEIGRRLGELLGMKVYDNELLTMAAKKKGLPEEYLRRVDERATGSLLYSIASKDTFNIRYYCCVIHNVVCCLHNC